MDENPYAPPKADLTFPSPAKAGPLEPAHRGLRLVGAIIDSVLSLVILFPLTIRLGWDAEMLGDVSRAEASLGIRVSISLLGVALFLLFHGFLLARHGQTVGKSLLGTRIVSVTDDRILPFGRLIALRYLPLWIVAQIPAVGMVFMVVDGLFVFREDRRCLHDRIAGTKVVEI